MPDPIWIRIRVAVWWWLCVDFRLRPTTNVLLQFYLQIFGRGLLFGPKSFQNNQFFTFFQKSKFIIFLEFWFI